MSKVLTRLLHASGYRVERAIDYRPHRLRAVDLAVRAIHPDAPDFFVVQVGANDGRRGDPIRHWIDRYRWRGVLLEPQPHIVPLLRDTYRDHPQVIIEDAAIAAHDGTVPMFTAPGKSLNATTDRAALRASSAREFPARAITFRTLLTTHAIDHVDLLAIDTEGFDYEVVKLAFAAGLRPRLLVYEHLHLTTSDRHACADLLGREGYQMLRDGTDTVALRD